MDAFVVVKVDVVINHMRGYYPTYDLFILEKLDYIETSSTIGNREPYKTERFEGHRETACEMAKDAILLLDTFLYKYGFGYSTADLGFCIG